MRSIILDKLLQLFHNTKLDRLSLIKGLGYRFLHRISFKEVLLANTIYGGKLYILPYGPVGESILKLGIWEGDTTNFLLKNLVRGEVFVDVGANIGYFTCLAGKLVGNSGLVIAFEPEPLNFRLLISNVKVNNLNNVICERLAVADFVGSAKLFLNPAEPGGHTLFPHVRNMKYCQVSTTTLDHYFATRKLPEPDMIKIDVEGAELPVLHGLDKLLSKPDLKIIIEFNPRFTDANLLMKYCLNKTLKPHIILERGEAVPIPIERLKALSRTVNLLLLR